MLNLERVSNFVENFYVLLSKRGRLFTGPSSNLPLNGIYIFFEEGQKIVIGSEEYNRIVRVGINEKPNNFRNRVRGHYNGNIEGSVFRENVGWALLEIQGKKPKPTYGTKKNYKRENSGGSLERSVSQCFADAFTFEAFNIEYDKLAFYEKILIAAFSIYYQYRIMKKTLALTGWLGLHSYSRNDKIRRSGLWNSNEVVLLDNSSLERAKYVRRMTNGQLKHMLNDMIKNLL